MPKNKGMSYYLGWTLFFLGYLLALAGGWMLLRQ